MLGSRVAAGIAAGTATWDPSQADATFVGEASEDRGGAPQIRPDSCRGTSLSWTSSRPTKASYPLASNPIERWSNTSNTSNTSLSSTPTRCLNGGGLSVHHLASL